MKRREALEKIGCHTNTLSRYVTKGHIRVTKGTTGRYNYWDEDVYAMIGKRFNKERWNVVYARINGHGARAEKKMQEQKDNINKFCVARGIIIDKSYEDWTPSTEFTTNKRKGLVALMEDVLKKRVDNVIVETRCRLARIGWEMFELLFLHHDCKLIIINKVLGDTYYQEEQAEDLTRILSQAKVDRVGDIK